MKTAIKTAAAALILCAAAYCQNIVFDLSTKEDPYERYYHFSRMERAGSGLVIGGATTLTVEAVFFLGFLMYAAADVSPESSFDRWIKSDDFAYTALYTALSGVGMLSSGIVLKKIGGRNAEIWKTKIPDVYIAPNGAGLVWNF